MRPTCAADWARRRSKRMRRRTAPGKHSGAPPSPRGCPVSSGRNGRSSSRRSMPLRVSRSCSTATAESTWPTPSPPAVPAAFPTGSGTTVTSTEATDRMPRMPIWQPDTNACWCYPHSAGEHWCHWSGARTLRRRSTNSAQAAAASKRSSRTATPSTCSARMPWICRCVRPLLALVASKAEPLPRAHRILALTPTKPVDSFGSDDVGPQRIAPSGVATRAQLFGRLVLLLLGEPLELPSMHVGQPIQRGGWTDSRVVGNTAVS